MTVPTKPWWSTVLLAVGILMVSASVAGLVFHPPNSSTICTPIRPIQEP